MSVGTPTEGKLGLVREKRGGREVGIIAIAYPDLLWVGGREKKSASLFLSQTQVDFSGNPGLLEVVIVACPCMSSPSCLENLSQSIHHSLRVLHQLFLFGE